MCSRESGLCTPSRLAVCGTQTVSRGVSAENSEGLDLLGKKKKKPACENASMHTQRKHRYTGISTCNRQHLTLEPLRSKVA